MIDKTKIFHRTQRALRILLTGLQWKGKLSLDEIQVLMDVEAIRKKTISDHNKAIIASLIDKGLLRRWAPESPFYISPVGEDLKFFYATYIQPYLC